MSIKNFMALIVMFAGLTGMASLALAVEPGEMLDDPVLEARAREISLGLRCVVCQNQSIDDSNAELARDMRVLVRDRLVNGDSNQQVLDYMVSRYGDFVLLNPPFKGATYFLWFGPFIFAAIGAFAVVMVFRRKKTTANAKGDAPSEAPHLSKAEQHRLEKLLNENEDQS